MLCVDDIELDDRFVRNINLLKDWEKESHTVPCCEDQKSFSNITSNTSTEFGTKFSSSTQIHDLWAVPREPNSRRWSVENSVLHALEPLVRAKRGRITNLQSRIPVCQVIHCNKDLSSSKDYHRRHRVCDLHSKTAMVIVNGLQQRFCQQCSRFHLLPEFDKGKRSCRKRLAGHNQRRRKPQLGSVFLGTDSSTSTMLSPKIFEGGFFAEQDMGLMNCSRHVKLEHELCQRPRIEVPTKFSVASKISTPSSIHFGKLSGWLIFSPRVIRGLKFQHCSLSSVSSITELVKQFFRHIHGLSSDFPGKSAHESSQPEC